MKRVLITGAAGFVGANLVRRLLQEGHQIHLFLLPDVNRWRLEEIVSQVRIYPLDLCDRTAVDKALSEIRPEWVFHLAAFGAYSTQTDLWKLIDTNIIGTINLVEACLKQGFEILVNTGSSSEYGLKDHPPSEREWLEPNSYYAVTKASATLYCRYTAQSRKVNIPTLRLYSVYGPYEEPSRLIPSLAVNGLRNRYPPLVNPDIARDFIYVDDVVNAYLQVARKPGLEMDIVLNVGTGTQTSLRQAVETVKKALGITAEPAWGSMQERLWDTKCWVADNRLICKILDWKPEYDFETGFRAFLDWLKARPEMLKFYQNFNSSI